MISKNFFLSTCLAIGLAATAMANTVVTTPAGQWHAAYDPNSPAGDSPFWNQSSDDGTNCNVGYWLAETTAWSQASGVGSRCNSDSFSAGTSGPGALSFLGSTGDPGTNVGWDFSATNSQTLSLLLEVAGNSAGNSLGWYTVDGSGARIDQGILIAGGQSPVSTAAINVAAGTQFGFYLCPNGDCSGKFYSGDGSGNTGGKFALFAEVPSNPSSLSDVISKYWIGVEDKPNGGVEGVGDFNDMLFTASVVPEPGFYAALALGLFGVFFYTWRRRQQSVENN